MNVESVRTGRRTTSTQRVVSVGTISTALTGAAPHRVALIVSAPNANRLTLSLEGTAVIDQGTTVYPSGDPLVLTAERHGDIVTRAWTAISATASQSVSVIEVFLTTQV